MERLEHHLTLHCSWIRFTPVRCQFAPCDRRTPRTPPSLPGSGQKSAVLLRSIIRSRGEMCQQRLNHLLKWEEQRHSAPAAADRGADTWAVLEPRDDFSVSLRDIYMTAG